jgi:GNAT superfamily N-acetyltransferase
MTLEIRPVGRTSFPDVAALFGPNGANSGCWCMWWRISAKEWSDRGRDGNRAAFEAVLRSGQPAGLLAYSEGTPVGWCAAAPRTAYPRLLRSPTLRLADPDDPGVWSVTCFFINRHHRRAGVAHALLSAAVGHAADAGATAVEGYPVDTGGDRRPSGDLFTGTVGLFAACGFTEYARPATGRRLVMRCLPSGSR